MAGPAERHSREEAAIRKALREKKDNPVSIAKIRAAVDRREFLDFTYGPDHATGSAFNKRFQRALARMEEKRNLNRLGKNKNELGDGEKTVFIEWKDNSALDELVMKLRERGASSERLALATMLVMAERLLKNQIPDAYLKILEPIFSGAQEEVAEISELFPSGRWRTRSLHESIHVISPGIQLKPASNEGMEVSDEIYRAIACGKCIDFDYYGKRSKRKESYRVGPLGVVFRGHKSYLVGENLSEASDIKIRVWSISRIENIEFYDKNYRPPEDFDIIRYIEKDAHLESAWDSNNNGPVDIRFRVLPVELDGFGEGTVVDEFQEFNIEGTLEKDILEDGSIRLHLIRRDTVEFRRWLRGYGDAIEVLSGLPGWLS